MNKYVNNNALLVTVLVIFGCIGMNGAVLAHDDDDELVDKIKKAPIVFDGDVAFRQADYVIDLISLEDPTTPGIQVNNGDQFKVYLPKGTLADNLVEFPVCTLATDCGSPLGPCAPGTLGCSTAIILQGRPQSPATPFPTVEVDNNVLTLTANGDYGPVAKNIHFIGKGFQNPGSGNLEVKVAHIRDGVTLAEGTGKIKIVPNIRPSINLFTPGVNALLQGLDQASILPWRFLIWDSNGAPFMDIKLSKSKMHRYQLRQNDRTIGHVKIDAPDHASGFSISQGVDMTIPTPLIGKGPGGAAPPPTQHYMFTFDAGPNPADGCYATTFELDDGNSWTLFVGSPSADGCADDDDDDDDDEDDDSD